jgi:hypothetical protein
MSGTFFIVSINALPEHEAEFNRWHSNRHVLDIIQTQGVNAARRFVLEGTPPKGAATHKYLCVYDAFDPPTMIQNMADRRARGLIEPSETFDREGMRAHFYHALPANKMRIDPVGRTAVYLEMFNPTIPDSDFERAYFEDYLPKVANLDGISSGQLLVAGPDHPFTQPVHRYAALYDVIGDPTRALAALRYVTLPGLSVDGGANRGVFRSITGRITKADAEAEHLAAAK